MTTTILLIRHAAHAQLGAILSGRLPNIALSPEGYAQARRLGATLAETRLDAVYASPVQRAAETAALVAEGQPADLTVISAEALDEVDFGEWQGRRFDMLEADPAWRQWNAARGTMRAPGGEMMAEVQRRLLGFAATVAARHAAGIVAFVSHCDVIRAGIAGWLGLSLDHVLRFDVDPASVSRIAIGDWGARVLSVNEGGR